MQRAWCRCVTVPTSWEERRGGSGFTSSGCRVRERHVLRVQPAAPSPVLAASRSRGLVFEKTLAFFGAAQVLPFLGWNLKVKRI